MKALINVEVCELEKKINRQIIVDEYLKLSDFCEFVIISLDGKNIPFYDLQIGLNTYFPDDEDFIDLTIKELIKNKTRKIKINYNNNYYFDIHIDEIKKDESNVQFEIISGTGYGIIDGESFYHIEALLDCKDEKRIENYCNKSEKEYLSHKFDCALINNKILDYIKERKERSMPKKYTFNVCLDGFNTEIKRKIVVNNNISMDEFCRKVILSMNGDLSHMYCIKKGKEWLDEENFGLDYELYFLNLKEKQKFKIMYDYGDSWEFIVTLAKIEDGFSDNDFEVIKGKGYGIIDDCGGIWGLDNIFSGENTEWGEYDINDFDLEECNNKIK